MKNYFLISLFFCVQQLNASAGQCAVKSDSDKKKDEFRLVDCINSKVRCDKCGPALHSNYRIDLSDSKLHVFIPDNYELWMNSKRCEKKCVFNALILTLRGITEKRFTLSSCKLPNGEKKYIFFDGVAKEFTFKVAGHSISETGCLVITKNGGIIYCASKDDAKGQLKLLAKHDARK